MIPSSRKLEKNSLIFRKKNFYYISGGNFPSSKKRKKTHSEKISSIFPKNIFLIFQGMELSSPKLKKL